MEISLLIKFGEKHHLEKMQKDGFFYCNTITYFSTLKDESRGDELESVTKLEYKENVFLSLKPANNPRAEWKKINVTKMLYKEFHKNPQGNLFCFSLITLKADSETKEYTFDPRFANSFNKYGLLILRQDLFLERLVSALNKIQYSYCIKPVEYLDLKKHFGKKNLFQKDLSYSWQEECRIVIHTNKYKQEDPFIFSIGNLSDISEIIDFSEKKTILYKL